MTGVQTCALPICAFPNVVVTSHQAFFTREALDAIARTTLSNAMAYVNDDLDSLPKPNVVC